ncbi:MAG: calcium-binding protein [Alphaproteobacteria bacterium]|nr:calcium-binding protein [Alphaproteobacteria bacterium]
MATYTFQGLRTTYSSTDGLFTSVAASTFSIVGPDLSTSFSYSVTTPVSASNPVPGIQLDWSSIYGYAFNGVPTSTTGFSALPTGSVVEIRWGAGKITQVLVVTLATAGEFLAVLGGDAIPLNGSSSPAEADAWFAAFTSFGAVNSGPFTAGTSIPFSSVAGMVTSQNDTIIGTDRVGSGSGRIGIINGSGDDYFRTGLGRDTVSGGSGDDIIKGEEGRDRLFGNDDNDRIFGGAGKDFLDGGTGADFISGGDANDTISGGTGSDTISGNDGNDRISGGGNADTINGGRGNDRIDGGAGNDTIEGGKGDDQIYGGTGNDTLAGGKGNDQIASADGDDLLAGERGNDRLDGGKGNDRIFGGEGNDILNGNKGNDRIYGGVGDDLMSGGKGADSFIFNEPGFGNDTVLDFDMATDLLLLGGFLVANPGVIFTNATDLVSTYASVVGGDVVFDFGTGDTITLAGLTSTLGLDAFVVTDTP